MTFLYDKGGCRSKEGKWLSNCKTSGFKSIDGCQEACMSLEVCLAINYNKSNKHCILITTSKPTNGCPKSATWKDTGIFAKSVDDLGPSRSDPDTVCYAKIPIDEKERR